MEAKQPETVDPARERWHDDDEIDLRQYIDVLVKWRREIVLLTVLTAVAAALGLLALRTLLPDEYEAASTVVISRTVSDVTFDERFRTLSDEDPNANSGNAASRRASLVGLVKSGDVAVAVIEELGDLLEAEERDPIKLLESIDATSLSGSDSRTQSDLIQITATADDPAKAAAIANTWVKHFVEHVNAVYGQVPAQVITSIREQANEAQTEYIDAQLELQKFIADNSIKQTNRIITGTQLIINELEDEKLGIFLGYLNAYTQTQSLALQLDQEGRAAILQSLVEAQVDGTLAVFEEQRDGQIGGLAQAYADQRRVESLLADARSLQAQVELGGDAAAASNNLALSVLKLHAFAPTQVTSPTLYSTLQVNLETTPNQPASAEEQAADIAALATVLEQRLSEIGEEIVSQSTALLSGENYQMLDELTLENFSVAGSELDEGDTDDDAEASALSKAITERYQDLFKVGELASAEQVLNSDNQFIQEIQALSESLMQSGILSQAEGVAQSTAEATPVLASPIDQIIARYEDEILTLQAGLEAQLSQRRQLEQRRDLAWSTLDTLQNKVIELNLEQTASNSQVRLGASALPPRNPVPGPSLILTTFLAAAIGFMLAVFVAFVANYMGKEPFLSRGKAAA